MKIAVLRRLKMIKVCEFCNNEFNASKSIRKFCCISCSIKGKRTNKGWHWKVKNKKPHTEEHKRKISQAKIGVKKSKETRKKISETRKRMFKEGLLKTWNKGIHMWEGKEHPRGMKGKTPWNFIDGSSKFRSLMLNEWRKIAKKCYKRDNYTCQLCSVRGGVLHAHHIIPWSVSKDDSMDNLITLCPKCHRKMHIPKRDKFGRFIHG